jgi:hypothetical protein
MNNEDSNAGATAWNETSCEERSQSWMRCVRGTCP